MEWILNSGGISAGSITSRLIHGNVYGERCFMPPARSVRTAHAQARNGFPLCPIGDLDARSN
jgi:hypothetical protein